MKDDLKYFLKDLPKDLFGYIRCDNYECYNNNLLGRCKEEMHYCQYYKRDKSKK